MASGQPTSTSAGINGHTYTPYRKPDSFPSESHVKLQQEYYRAIDEALDELVENGLAAYANRIKAFVQSLRVGHDVADQNAARYHALSLCMLGQYKAAGDIIRSPAAPKVEVAPTAQYETFQTSAVDFERRQSAPATSRRPAASLMARSPETADVTFGAPLVAIHSVDAAGLPQYRASDGRMSLPHVSMPPPPRTQPSPPAPPLPPRRPVAATSPTDQTQLPHRPVSVYDPNQYGHGGAGSQHTTPAVVKRRPVSTSLSSPQPLPTPPYSPSSAGLSASPNGQARLERPSNYFPPSSTSPKPSAPPQAAVALPQQQQLQARHPLTTPQHLQRPQLQPRPITQPQTQSQRPLGIATATRPPHQQQSHLQRPRPVPNKGAGTQLRPNAHSTPIRPGGQQGITGPPTTQPKQSKMDKFKKFSKTPAGKIAMRVGTGLVVASLTGGMMGGDPTDAFGGDGVDVDVGDLGGEDMGGADFGGGDFGSEDAGATDYGTGYAGVDDYGAADYGSTEFGGVESAYGGTDGGDYAGFEGDPAAYDGYGEYGTFDDQTAADTGMADYGAYGTYEDQVVMGGGVESYGEGSQTFENQTVTEAYYYESYDTGTGAYDTGAYDTGASGGAVGDGSELPGQIGPCFEDNVILSAATG